MSATPTPTTDQAIYSGLVDDQTADLARYLGLDAGLASVEINPFPPQPLRIPHINADAVRQAILIDRADRHVATASRVAGIAAVIVAIGAAAQVVIQFVGSVL